MRGTWGARAAYGYASARQFGTFLYIWSMIAVAAGALMQLAKVPRVAELARSGGWMWAGIGACALLSVALAFALTRLLFQYRARAVKYAVVLGITGLAGTALWGWSAPDPASFGDGGSAGEVLVPDRSAEGHGAKVVPRLEWEWKWAQTTEIPFVPAADQASLDLIPRIAREEGDFHARCVRTDRVGVAGGCSRGWASAGR